MKSDDTAYSKKVPKGHTCTRSRFLSHAILPTYHWTTLSFLWIHILRFTKNQILTCVIMLYMCGELLTEV
jgi:hypothetical protein